MANGANSPIQNTGMAVSKLTYVLEIFNSSVIVFNNGPTLVTEGLKFSDTKKIAASVTHTCKPFT